MTPTATPGKAEDSDAAGTHALTREQRCGARQAWQSADLQRWLQALRKRWSPRRAARQIVPWSSVIAVTPRHVQLDLNALDTPAFDWERWLRKHVVSKIPGSGAGAGAE